MSGPPEVLGAAAGLWPRIRGRFKSFDPARGYGFLRCAAVPDKDVYFQASDAAVFGAVPEQCATRPGQPPCGPEAEFELQWRDGRPRAVSLTLVGSRSLAELKAGEALAGVVAYKSRAGAYVDVGCGTEASVLAPVMAQLLELETGQAVNATVERVDAEAGTLCVSVDGLPKPAMLEDWSRLGG